MRRLALFASISALVFAVLPLAPVQAAGGADPDVIPGSYIVVLNEGEPGAVAAEHSRRHNSSVTHVYRHALRGYAARMSEQAAANVARDARVAYVDEDRVVTTAHHQCGHTVKGVTGPCDTVPSGTITGTVVKQSDSTPIFGATVSVDGTSLTTTTDGSGVYTLTNVPEGGRNVTASATDFDAQTKSTTVVAGETVEVHFALTASQSSPPPADSSEITPWGVARIGASSKTGDGVHVYVLDTGIDLDHPDLVANVDAVNGFASESCKGGSCQAAWDDDHGHGTHVAGTIGAVKGNGLDVLGVAPGVTLHAVKVLAKNGMGSRSGIIAGIDYVRNRTTTSTPAVVNMSLSGSGSKTGSCGPNGVVNSTDAYYSAICNAKNAGVVFVVAAGNDGVDAETRAPAAYDDAVITVSATSCTLTNQVCGSGTDDWPYWSNWGNNVAEWTDLASAPVAIAAPGVSVLSTKLGGGTTTMSGTSMASPHAAGAVALYLQEKTWSSPAFDTTRQALLTTATSVANNTSGEVHTEKLLNVEAL